MTTRRTLTAAEKDIAEVLRRKIREKNITQEQLAAKLGITQGVVWQWVNGKIAISPEKALALAETLGLEPSDLSARYSRIVEGTGRATLKFTSGRSSAAKEQLYVRDSCPSFDFEPKRPAIARLVAAIADADARGALNDNVAASIAVLIEALQPNRP